MGLELRKAVREKIWTKVLIGGSSGSGKTFSALRLATGLASVSGGAGVAAIDTENKRIRYYASEFDFSDIQITPDFTPEKYIEAIDIILNAGFNVIIIDSISHEWNYCNDLNGNMVGNSWANWRQITPRHDKFMEKVLQSPCHIIATVRGKDEYVQDIKDGKTVVKKVGVGFKQRDNIEYDYTVTFNIIDKDTHVADVMKDNTHLFEGKYEKLTEQDGINLYGWANSGEGAMPTFVKLGDVLKDELKKAEELTIDELKELIKVTFKSKMDSGIAKEILYDTIEGCGAPKNFNNITDIGIAKVVVEKLELLEKVEEKN